MFNIFRLIFSFVVSPQNPLMQKFKENKREKKAFFNKINSSYPFVAIYNSCFFAYKLHDTGALSVFKAF